MNEEPHDLWELLKRLRGVRFSLATCALLVLTIGATIAAWANRHPWMMVQSTSFQSNKVATYRLLSDEGKILVHRPHTETRLAIWDWRTGELQTVEFPSNEMLLESTAGGRLLTADKKGTARVRQLGLKFPIAERTNWVHPTAVNLRISADGNRIAGSGADGAVWIYDLNAQKETVIPAKTKSPNWVHLEFSPNGRWLKSLEKRADTSELPSWQLIDCDQGTTVTVPGKVAQLARVTSPYASTFASNSNCIFLNNMRWDIGTQDLKTCPGFIREAHPTFVCFAVKGGCEIWSTSLTEKLGILPFDPGIQKKAGFSPNGSQRTRWTADSFQSCATIWDTSTGKRIHTFPPGLQSCCFLSENHILARDIQKGELQVWWRRRPEAAWGMLGLPEVWLALAFLGGTIFSIRRDQRIAKKKCYF